MMSLKAVRTKNDAGPHEATKSKSTDIPPTPSPSPSATTSTTQDEPPLRILKIFPFINDTYRDLKRFISGFHKDSMSSQFIQTVNKYKNGCSEIYGKALESHVMCYKLAENIVRTIDIFKELCTCLSDLEEYNYRLCEIMSIFITCELRLSVDATEQEHILIAHRIIYIIRRHLVQEEQNETLHNILRTLVYIPKLFNARDIMCAIFGEFIPLKPMPEVNVLPDKLYMLYIIVFYRWMMMQKDDDDKLLIVNFAESFMKPSVSLCSNNLYGAYLPMYTTHSTATRTILNNLKFYRDIRNASIIDNALKKVGTIVNLCDDDEDDDIIILGSASTTTDFAQIFSSVRLEPLSGSFSKIKLEVTTVVDTVDLTVEEEPVNANTSIVDRHEKWLNEFQKLAQQYRESQLLLQKQQHNQLISTGEKAAIISLDSDSEGEEEPSVGANEETGAGAKETTPKNNCEDLFVDNYPLTNTPLNYYSDVESLDAEDENDVTKISPRFLSSTLRTYQAKKSNLYETGDKSNSDADEQNKLKDLDKSYRRDSIHISSTPPDETQNDDDDGTDVQDEHDDLLEEEEEIQAYAFLPTANKRAEKDTLPIRPMGPYPTYNNMDNDKAYYSHTSSLHQHQQQQPPNKYKQYYYSDSSETKTAKKQKKKVQFSTKPLGPNVSKGAQTIPLKPALHQNKYKVSEAPENYRLRGFDRFSCANSNDDASSTLGSTSTISSTKQQESTNARCISQQIYKVKNFNHNNKCSNFYKNLSVFKRKSSSFNFKEHPIKNVKISLKKLRLDKDISLTNFKSNLISEEKPHTTSILIENSSSNNHNNNATCTKTESFPLKSSIHNNDDDTIFKKPLPVTNKLYKSLKSLKNQRAVYLRRHPHYIRHKPNHAKLFNNLTPSTAVNEKAVKEINILSNNQVTNIEKEYNSASGAADDVVDTHLNRNMMNLESESDMDDLTKISKLLTDEINSLTCNKNVEKLNKVLANNMDSLSSSSCNPTSNKDVGEISSNLESVKTTNDICLNPLMLTEKLDKNSLSIYCEETTNKVSERGEDEKSENENPVVGSKFEPGNKILGDWLSGTDPDVSKNEDLQSNENTNDERPTSNVEQSNVKNADSAQDFTKLVTNFSAEFLAGLPNETSPSPMDSVDIQCEGKNEIDFEFENNCSTPTMCRIDLDAMSENTCDDSHSLSAIEDCEADKLLEEFNNKTENIVGTALNKKTLVSPITFSRTSNESLKTCKNENSPVTDFTSSTESLPSQEDQFNNTSLVINNNKEALKRSHEKDLGAELSKSLKKEKKNVSNECLKSYENEMNVSSTKGATPEQGKQSWNEPKTVTSTGSSEKIEAKIIHSHSDHKKMSTTIKKDSKALNDLTESEESLLSYQTNFCNRKESKKLNKHKHSKFSNEIIRPFLKENNEENMESQNEKSCNFKINEKNNCSKREQFSEGEKNPPSKESSPPSKESSKNENQHMTVELDKIQTNACEDGGVSAIFSFPKIPIISISIHTTPSNKTYFKISNRENDNQVKDNVKMKRIKSCQSNNGVDTTSEGKSVTLMNRESDNQTKDDCNTKINKASLLNNEDNITNKEKVETAREKDNEIKEGSTKLKINSSQIYKDGNSINEVASIKSNMLESTIISNNDLITSLPTEDYSQEEVEEFGKEDDDDERDNFEIEKFSHDSNSACSLPLKKRPTQAEPNGDSEDLEATICTGYEQPQEIAAEVVVENTHKSKLLLDHNSAVQSKGNDESGKEEYIVNNDLKGDNNINEFLNLHNDFDDNMPSTSSACFKKILDPSSPFKRRVHTPIRQTGHTPIQIVAPQLKDNSLLPSQDYRTSDTQMSSASRMGTQNIQTLPESYPATPMLSVANVEKLMDFNRFIEDLLASPDVVTIIDNANACGYYAEGHTYEMERIAILEHYNIANAKGNVSATKPLYWKKSAGDTISIFNDNDNEWISLPPSTAKQLQKLSFVLSILQQQYKVTDVRQRINIALTFLIRNTSKFKNISSTSLLHQRKQLYSRNISDNSPNHCIAHTLPSTSYFRMNTSNEALNTKFNLNSNVEGVQDFNTTNYSNAQQQPEIALIQEPTANQNWNTSAQLGSAGTAHVTESTNSLNSPQRNISNNIECEQQQQVPTPDKRSSCWDELNNDQLYINPPCATSPQNEVIVNTNGVQLHEIPQDPQNIFISITDESANGSSESTLHKYNARQQQQQFRTVEDFEILPSSSSINQQTYGKRPCLVKSTNSLISNHFLRNNIPNFGNQEINLQNPYRIQQQQLTNHNVKTSSSSNSAQRNLSQEHSAVNIYHKNNGRRSAQSGQQQEKKRMCTRLSSSFNNELSINTEQSQTKCKDSNYKEILQPYITYLIKDHEKTSKHLLQVFEEVSNSNTLNGSPDNNLNQHQPQFNSLMPTLIRNPQQNHMPGFHQVTNESCGNVLPSLIRKPLDNSFINRDSGALQLVQSFLEQSQTSFESAQQQRITTDQKQQKQELQTTSTVFNPGFASEYINFVGTRDEIAQKLHNNLHKKRKVVQQHQQLVNDPLIQQQESQHLSSVNQKRQERNDKLAEDLKRKMIEFSLLKHNVQVKELEKQEKLQEVQIKQMEISTITTKCRGRPKKVMVKSTLERKLCDVNSPTINDQNQNIYSTRVTRRKQSNYELPTATTTDHAYYRQRSAAREAVKRINATANNSYY